MLIRQSGLYGPAGSAWLDFCYAMSDGPVQNLRTGARYDYVQHAVAAAEPGDQVVAAPGLYAERIDFAGKPVTVRSTDPGNPAVVAATTLCGCGNVVTFVHGEDANSVLDGLTVTGGSAGVLCHAATPTIRRCNVTANYGPGIRLASQSNPTILGCNVTANDGPGIELQTIRDGRLARYSRATIRNCIIAANRRGGVIGAKPNIANCTIVENLGDGVSGTAPTLVNSIVYFNNVGGDGVQIRSTAAGVKYCDVQGGWPDAAEGEPLFNMDADPLFVRTGVWRAAGPAGRFPEPITHGNRWAAGDYHLQSQGWRWDARNGEWTSDAGTSPCIDAGDPAFGIADEPANAPDGPAAGQTVNTRIDMGAYGGTAEASLAPVSN